MNQQRLTSALLPLVCVAFQATRPCHSDDVGERHSRQRTVARVIKHVTVPTDYPPSLSPDETEVDLRHTGFSPTKMDEPQLLAAFRDKNNDLVGRLCLASYLAQLENEEARKFLLECLEGKHVEKPSEDDLELRVRLDSTYLVRRNAVYAVNFAAGSSTRINWAVRQMMQIVEDEREFLADSRAVLDVCTRLGRVKSMEVVQVLIGAVRRCPTAYEPALALGEIGDMRAEKVLLDTVESRGKLATAQSYALYQLKSKKLVPVLLRHLYDSTALSILVEWKDQRAVEPLKRFIAAGGGHVDEAKLALARIESRNKAELAARLIGLLEDKSMSDIRWQIIEPLGATRDGRAIDPLVSVGTKCTSDLEWSHVVDALEQVGGEDAVDGLKRLLRRDFSTLVIDGKPPYRQPRKEVRDAISRLEE